MMIDPELKKLAVSMRLRGESYSSISKSLGISVPKSTMSYWFRGLKLPEQVERQIAERASASLAYGREIARHSAQIRREEYEARLQHDNAHLAEAFANTDTAKITLAILFLAEGTKREDILVFCSSDPYVIDLFLHLLRACYRLEDAKLHCTVQCRADQDIAMLERFWSTVTHVQPANFYKAQVDKRTIGNPTNDPEYKGVCRIEYFSATVSRELSRIPKIIYRGL